MKPEFLKLMKCPYCGTAFEMMDIYEEKEGDVISGCVRCGCSEFSIIEGILNLKVGPLNSYLTKLLMEGESKVATGLLLEKYVNDVFRIATFLKSKGIYGQALGRILSDLMKARAKRTSRKYLDKNASFYNLLGGGPFESYLKHRFSAESLWSVYPFIPVLKKYGERVLDLGCGAGHASFVISAYVKPRQLVCADHAFSNLYLAKKYFAKGAEFICLDANYPLPFKDDIFTTVFMLDAFHYVQARASLAGEMERILLPQGFLLLLHLHNSLIYNPSAGKPLSPSGWINLFHQLPVKALPERNLIEDFIMRNKLDLAKKHTEGELNSSNAIALITARDEILTVFEEANENFLRNKSNLLINPIYRIDCEDGKIILHRDFPSEELRKDKPLTEKQLPTKYVIDETLSKIVKGRTLNMASSEISEKDLYYIEDLMRKFIVINVPKGYY